MEEIKTDRLLLRKPQIEDAPEVARQIAQWDVIRWLTSPPWPYTLADAEEFFGSDMSDGTWIITDGDAVLGVVGIDRGDKVELGYWLGKDHWGQGYMTEAATALADHHFAAGNDSLSSGFLIKNQGSKNVLLKLGFELTEVTRVLSRPLGHDVDVQKVRLSRDRWEARRD